ncbi:hypothetical protein AcV5_006829 [Taiwanofungus camphoratus]|nr:hypothetical protein AcV5_006829 [Antrodia cinnamomea]
MKGVSVCLLLTGFSQAVHIYLHPFPSLSSASLSATQAGVTLSRHLGLEYFESLGDNLDLFDGVVQEPFVGKGSSRALLLSIGEEYANDVIPSSLEESIRLSTEPSSSTLSSLIPTYLERARHTYSHVFSQNYLPSSVPRILDIFSVPSSATETFLSEMTTIVDFLESDERLIDDGFAALELKGLTLLATEYGRASEQYRLAIETVRSSLVSAATKPDLKLAIVTVPVSVSQSKRQLEDVQQPPQSPFPPSIPGPAEPIDAISTCFSTADACANSTGGCSGHGECAPATKAGRTCFVCACAATKDARGRTENWAGSACERKDVSGPFVLLTGTVVTLIVLVGGSIALLSAIGDQELPSTLTGGIVPTTRRD